MANETTWKVALLVNIADQPVTQCEFSIHQYPDELVALRNQICAPFQQHWVILMRITPFPTKQEAEEYCNHWLFRTRGVARRIAKGFYLVHQYRDLTLQVIPLTLQQQQQEHKSPLSLDQPTPLAELITRLIASVSAAAAAADAAAADTTPASASFAKTPSPSDIVRLYDVLNKSLSHLSPSTLNHFVSLFPIALVT